MLILFFILYGIFLKVMKKHFNLLFLIFLIPFSICSQNFTITDTNRQFSIEPRFFGINSFQEDGPSSTMYLMGEVCMQKLQIKYIF